MKLLPWELDILAASETKRIKIVEDKVWGIIVKQLATAINKNSLEDSKSTQDWLNELLVYRDELQNEIAPPVSEAFNKAIKQLQDQMDDSSNLNLTMEEAWMANQADQGYLKKAEPLSKSKSVKHAVADHKRDDIKYLKLAKNNMDINAYRAYKGIIMDTITRFKAGGTGMTTQKAVARASYKWADQGIPVLIDKGGKQWAPDVYTRMVVTNSMNDLYNDVSAARFQDYGGNLVKISSHSDCRPTHLQYQGQIYSLKGGTDKYPNLYTATNYGYGGGLCGMYCRHHAMPYIPEVNEVLNVPDVDDKENNRRYHLVQQQRRYENVLRQGKRRLKAAQAMEDEDEISHCKWLVNRRSKRLREFVRDNGLTREPYRERPII